MKACRVCGRLYPDEAGFCPIDGQELYSATQVPIASDDADPRIGALLCQRYQIRRVVADGGMGRVYEALDMVGQRNVAVKVLHPEVSRDGVAVERFKREFEVSKELPHEHIVEVTDFQATGDGSYALVMEFLYGEELRSTLKRQKVVKPSRLVRMLSQVAIGLDAAHAKKLVHRDLKPDNLFLCQTTAGDMVKILDFGSVKDKTTGAKKLTVMGTTIGSPYYMAPEQAQGLDTLDQRADVWALAAIGYECIAGVVPFRGNSGPAILLEILTKEPQAPSVAGKGQKYPIPPSVDRAILAAMKKTASLRTPSVGALADQVGRAYGLEGDHLVWANAPEEQLEAQINSKMDALLKAAEPEKRPQDAAADSFFGEGDSLGVAMDGAFAGAAAAAVPAPTLSEPIAQSVPAGGGSFATAPMSARGTMPDVAAVPAGVPSSRLGWWLVPVVVVVAILLGVLIAWLM
ncbi:MAG TPA: serine/threonine-protein kinase [Polyangiaceae bacterium]|nr:serine/threonine-protein kinase [Polyangiaceae bacterium]